MDALEIKVLRKSGGKEGEHQTTLCLDWVFAERSQPTGRRYGEQVAGRDGQTAGFVWHAGV